MSSNPLFDHRHLGLILALHDLILFAYILDVALYDLVLLTSSLGLYVAMHLGRCFVVMKTVVYDMLRTGDRGTNRTVALLHNTVYVCHLLHVNYLFHIFRIPPTGSTVKTPQLSPRYPCSNPGWPNFFCLIL